MPARSAPTEVGKSEAEFIEHLRAVTDRYLQTVDAWEIAYAKYYRLAGSNRISPDLEPFHQDYLRARSDLHRCLGRVRQLCMKYNVRDPWQSLHHIELGANSPQTGAATAIGRGERNLLADCLGELTVAVQTPGEPPARREPRETWGEKSLLQRLIDFLLYRS